MINKIENQHDIEKILNIMKNIINQPCWNAYFSYGEELFLEIGEKKETDHPLSGRMFEGSWWLGNRGNYFELFSLNEMVILKDQELDEVKKKLNIIIDTTITDIQISYPELTLSIVFSNESSLKIFADDDDEHNLAYWELFTPENKILRFGPQRTWTYEDANLPIGEKKA